jgi:hypothetical protein
MLLHVKLRDFGTEAQVINERKYKGNALRARTAMFDEPVVRARAHTRVSYVLLKSGALCCCTVVAACSDQSDGENRNDAFHLSSPRSISTRIASDLPMGGACSPAQAPTRATSSAGSLTGVTGICPFSRAGRPRPRFLCITSIDVMLIM